MNIVVIGTGYIGISTVLHYVKKGHNVTGIDVNINKIEKLNQGILPQQDLKNWLSFDTEHELEKAKFYYNFDILNEEQNIDAIFVAIPTEKNGKPYFSILESVIKEITKRGLKNKLTIIESTLTPGVSEKYIKPFLNNFVVAPRRDWFGERDKTVDVIPRIVGGNNEQSTTKAVKILSEICNTLLPCTNIEAELVKAVENSQRHLGIIYANQLAFAYPELNIRKILKLAGSKWNAIEYYPSTHVGGYCINLSSQYVIKGSKKSEELTLLHAALDTDSSISKRITSKIITNDFKSTAILGLSYLADIKVDILSAGSQLLRAFEYWLGVKDEKIKINDPLWTKEEIEKRTGYKTFNFNDLDKFEYIFLMAGHKQYKNIDPKIWIEKTKNAKLLFDNTGILENIKLECPYSLMGRPGWLNKI